MRVDLSLVKPFIIAEVSGNHNGSLERTLEIVRAMAGTGVDAVKFQTYTADTITLDVDVPPFRVSADHPLWGDRKLHDLYKEASFPWEWHEEVFDVVKGLGMEAFSTPFDETAVDFLETLGVPRYKIASLEIVDLPLIRQVSATGKPVIISTGTATLGEIEDAVTAAQDAGATDITLLVCTSSYPAKPADAHLARIPVLKDLFGVNVGLSDHTVGLAVAVAAVALGATMIEKHVTLARADGGVDAEFSAEPAEVKALVEACHDAAVAVGSTSAWRTDAEAESTRLRPSLYVTTAAKAGDLITHDNVRSVRPGGGLAPKHLDAVIGQRFTADVEPGTPVQWNLVG